MSGLTYYVGDERPSWQATVTVNGVADDMSTGYTFVVKVAASLDGTAVLTKSTNITGATGGVVTVAWADGDLAQTAGEYVATLTATRVSDSAEWTVSERISIRSIPT